MDKQLIGEKLESLRKCIKRIEQKCPDKLEIIENDLDIQDIVSVNLTRAIQVCVDIAAHIVSESDLNVPDTMAELFEDLEQLKIINHQTVQNMKSAVGFRNIAVHNYDKINWLIVFKICKENLDDFKKFAKAINDIV